MASDASRLAPIYAAPAAFGSGQAGITHPGQCATCGFKINEMPFALIVRDSHSFTNSARISEREPVNT